VPAGGQAGPANQYLTDTERLNLTSDTRSRVDNAFNAFGWACNAHREAIKNEAKARAELLSAVIEIAAGFGAPAFATIATTRLAAKAASRAAAAGATPVKTANVVSLISQTDKFKATFSGVTKAATTTIKNNAMPLFGETDIDKFSSGLRDAFHAGAQDLNTSLGSITDDDALFAIWSAYDVEFTKEAVYKDALTSLFNRYRSQVGPIGTQQAVSRVLYSRVDTRAYRMDAYGKVRLALLQDQLHGRAEYRSQARTFVAWISDDLADVAVKVTEERFGKVETIDPGTITGHIPDPNTGK
jgi:hypothetical protein